MRFKPVTLASIVRSRSVIAEKNPGSWTMTIRLSEAPTKSWR